MNRLATPFRLAACAATLFAASCATSERFVAIGNCDASHYATGVNRLEVRNRAGSIVVSPSADEQVGVLASVSVRESLRQEFPAADAARDLKIVVDGDTLRIADAHEDDFRNDFQLDLVITAPARLCWKLELGAGNVDATGGGNAVDVHSGAGNVSIHGAVAAVRADVGAGNVVVDVETLAGGTLHSGAGSVKLTLDRGGITERLSCTSGAGQVVISVPAGFSADAALDTGAGSLVIDGAALTSNSHLVGGTASGRLGKGGPPLIASSGAGGVTLRVRN